MAYCAPEDLLLEKGMTHVPGEKQRFIDFAAESMDAKLGFLYMVPIDPNDLPPYQQSLIKTINIKIATGRMLMASAIGQQNTEVNAYAAYLIREGETDLMSIANGQVDLQAPRVNDANVGVGVVDDPSVLDPYARIPGGWNPDSTSAVTVFEKNFMTEREALTVWDPSDNIANDGQVSKLR